ncbi:MAG TPA: Smr/MutS family protein [Xanthobacteraceae bacterium]
MSRRRQLSDEEQALWSGFARSIAPLRQQKKSGKATMSDDRLASEPAKPNSREPNSGEPNSGEPRSTKAPEVRLQPPAAKTPPLAPLGRRLKQRVARGREPIDARIDLHGMTQARAHAALLGFLQRSQDDGARMALVVTGKGSGGSARDSTAVRGVLKRQVPIWLSLPEFRAFIVGFEDAHIGHGGEGALYVRLRRPR